LSFINFLMTKLNNFDTTQNKEKTFLVALSGFLLRGQT